MLMILTLVLQGAVCMPVGLLAILALADACDGAHLDAIRGLSPEPTRIA